MSDIQGFRAFSWQPIDLLSQDYLNTVNGNIQALHNYMPRTAYGGEEGTIAYRQSVKILSGRKLIAPTGKKKDSRDVNVQFASFFSGGCRPNISTGINANIQNNIYVTFSGNGSLLPDNTGMTIHVQVAKEADEKSHLARRIFVHYNAIGY